MIKSHRSINYLDIELGPLTVLFGKNNVGKTSVLEALFGTLAPDRMADPHIEPPQRTPGIRSVSNHDLTRRGGAVFFKLVDNVDADDEIRDLRHQAETLDDADYPALPNDQVAYVCDGWGDDPGLMFVDPRRYFAWGAAWDADASPGETLEARDYWPYDIYGDDWIEQREQCASFRVSGRKPRAIYLDWEFLATDELVAKEPAAVCVYGHNDRVSPHVLIAEPFRWLEAIDNADPVPAWRLNPVILERMERFGRLATELLPDFIDGSGWGEDSLPQQELANPANHLR